MGSADAACGHSHQQVIDIASGSAGNEGIKDVEYLMSQHKPLHSSELSKYSNYIHTNLIVLPKE